jgi:hypothetical protein
MVLAVAWAVYLIPKALKHHDEVARTRSIDRFSTAMRVLARREPVNRRDTRLVVTPARPQSRMLLPTTQTAAAVAAVVASSEVTAVEDVRRPASPRAAAHVAARRRRHLLMFLVLAGAVVVGVAAFGYLPWWTAAIPGGLIVAHLFVCRFQVRRENRVARSTQAVSTDDSSGESSGTPRRGVRVGAPYGTPPASRDGQGSEEVPAEEVTAVAEAAAAAPATNAGSLWDPLPMTLPTYVSKPSAARTVRTIDLSAPNTWSSGRSEADSKLVEETAAAREAAAEAADGQRAVGS